MKNLVEKNKITIFDSTLRDGAQAEGISFTVEDKIKIATALDDLGVDYIEAGNPGSNPKDLAFFEHFAAAAEPLKNAKLIAFGSTRRKGISAAEDDNIKALLQAQTAAVCIFGKTWDFHVTEILRATLDENLEMIADTIRFFKQADKEVIFDAEHFFDGCKSNEKYAMLVLETAKNAGADAIVLCDTNGGCFPNEIFEMTKKAVELVENLEKSQNTGKSQVDEKSQVVEKGEKIVPIGIHTHNDCEMAVANSIMAVQAGATHVQGTFTGFGERCGNANLSAIIPNLQLKLGFVCVGNLAKLTQTARYISEVANIPHNRRAAYTGKSAFAHKGGMHIDAVEKASSSFEHINPELVGNERKYLMSEVAGRSMLIGKIQQISPELTKESPQTIEIIGKLKELEQQGYQFEGAESSFGLYIRKLLGKYKPLFELVHFKTIGEQPQAEESAENSASAIIKITVNDQTEITAAEGSGPVNALDKALRKALEKFYPELANVHLTDYKVRVLDSTNATASKVRVLIESTDGTSNWTTVGVSADIIEASWLALVDSIEYKLIKEIEEKFKAFI
ncbi:MAG: citramalate synthase [Firmicutes bacterium]|nr:citramalate synthase [Bacillota bacterium]